MALADDIISDLDDMMGDWGDSVTIGGTAYDCLYDRSFVENADFAGFLPVVTLTAANAQASGVALGDSVSVTSVINVITDKAFTVRIIEPQGDGETKLVLEEA